MFPVLEDIETDVAVYRDYVTVEFTGGDGKPSIPEVGLRRKVSVNVGEEMAVRMKNEIFHQWMEREP